MMYNLPVKINSLIYVVAFVIEMAVYAAASIGVIAGVALLIEWFG